MQKPIIAAGCVGLVLLGTARGVGAVSIEAVPNPRTDHGGWVTDMANMLSPETEAQLEQRITDLEAKNGCEIAVVTVPDTQPSASPKAFATSLFNTWKIGKADKNNGVLVLIAQKEHRVEVEVGRGLTTVLPNMNVTNLLATQVKPQFQQGKFDAGTLAGTQAIADVLETADSSTKDPSDQPLMDTPFFLGLMFFGSTQVFSWVYFWLSRVLANRRRSAEKQAKQKAQQEAVVARSDRSDNLAQVSQDSAAVPPAKSTEPTARSAQSEAIVSSTSESSHESSTSSDSSSWSSSDSSWSSSSADSSSWGSSSSDSSSWSSSDSSWSSSSSDSSSSWSSSDSSSSSSWSSSDFGGGFSDGGGGGCGW